MATYAVGDIQGCLTPLKTLLNDVSFNVNTDTLWLTGDLINRGPSCLDTLRFVYEHRDCFITVLGNHDLHLLAINAGARKPSSADTLSEILQAPDKDELLYWLQHQPLIHRDKDLGYTMVHAGIPPQWSLKKAKKRAEEVEQILCSDRSYEFFSTMYSNEPSKWRKGLEEVERWRVITNYFTRMRFCTPKGKVDLKEKRGLDSAPEEHKAWFAHEHRKTINDTIIFGHWAALEGVTHQTQTIALDTGYVWGNSMTMMCLDDGKRYTVSAPSRPTKAR